MYRFVCSLLIFLLSVTGLSAQQASFTFKNITRSNGLPVDEITTLAQDSTGFIWLGSIEGLFRYDGFSFKNFSFDGSSQTQSAGITRILVNKKGRLWVGSLGNGLSCMMNNGTIIKLVNSSTSKSISESANYVTDIKEDPAGNIWWTTTDGLYTLEKNGSIISYKTSSALARGNTFNHLVIDAKGAIWVSGYLGLFTVNKNTGQLERGGETETEKDFFSKRKDFAALAFQGNTVWYSTWNPELGGYNRLSTKSQVLYSGIGSPQPDFDKKAGFIYQDSRSAIWMGTGKGVHWIKTENSPVQSFTHDAANPFSLVHNKVNAILEDREGNFWFATKKGLSVARPYEPAIVNITFNSRSQFPFADKEINDVINADKETLLVGTHEADGIYMTDLQFNPIRHWRFHNVAHDWVWRFFDDSTRNRIFISTQEGMLLYDKKTREIEKIKDTLLHNFFPATSFVSTSDSILWISRFWNRFMRYNLVTGHFKIYDITQMGERPQVLYLSKDEDNRLWIRAHNSGIWRWDEEAERIVERLEKRGDTTSIKEAGIFSFLDLGKFYLIGYNSKGISLYEKSTGTFRHITRETGLVSNMVRHALIDRDSTVWIATKNGISHFFPNTGALKNYNYETGILHNDFLHIRQLKDGRIVAGSTMGLVYFRADELDKKQQITAPIVTDVTIYGKTIPWKPADSGNQRIGIGYGDNYFSFEFISLHYSSPQRVEYSYKLEGLDKDWIQAGPRRFVSYSRVPGGNYTFKVRARLPGNNWVESKYPVKLHVQTAFYKQWWFYILCILFVTAIVYALFRYRLQQILNVERMRTAISSDLHDEVGASLTSISLFSEMARQSKLPEQKKEEYLQRIGERSRDSIEKMGDIIWSINPENDNLKEMLVRMKNYAVEVTEARDINLEWQEQGNFNQSKLTMQQRKNFYLVFKEAINNSVKHGEARNLEVLLEIRNEQIKMHIRDDGRGFTVGQAPAGNGLKNMERRGSELGGTVSITSIPGKGTTVILVFSS